VKAHDLNFRLYYADSKNEIGIIATSFNRVLDRIQALVESQKSFISYASHELRTPLAALNGILETSLNYDADKKSMELSITAAHREVGKATKLVNGLLQLTKIEAIKDEAKVKLNIIDLLLDTISFYKLKNPLQEFVFDMVPSQTSNIEVLGYPEFIRTAIINVLDNASKYSYQDKIEIKLSNELDKIYIRIIDRGIGIQEDERHQLVNIFYRGKNTFGIEGFGLGLSLTQKIITLHQGIFRLRPNSLKGTIAEIILPAIVSSYH
jgi:signal transduction histidine kinase